LESSRRLSLLFEAGSCRFAVEATSVVEVASPDADGLAIRGVLELVDLSLLLGGGAEALPGFGVILDTSPTLAVRVRRVVEVADVAGEPFFLLPPDLAEALGLLVRGAILHGGRLYLELIAEALTRPPALPASATLARAIHTSDLPPDRGLVFESEGRLFGIPLSLVSQVVAATDAFCPLPAPGGGAAGMFPHAQVLWPIYSVPGLLGQPARREELFILTELAGRNVGISAARVLGVHQGFSAAKELGEFECAGLATPVLFLDLQRMFS
jgi:hypothetical protein